jgi:hypothetical protein
MPGGGGCPDRERWMVSFSMPRHLPGTAKAGSASRVPASGVSSYLLEVNKQIDGLGRNDILLLTFQTPVTLVSATFSGVDVTDSFVLLGKDFWDMNSDGFLDGFYFH